VVPTTDAYGRQAANDVGYDVVEIEDPAIVQEPLQYFRTNAENEGAGEKSNVQVSTTGGIEDPVETGCENEEREGMEDLVIDVCVEL